MGTFENIIHKAQELAEIAGKKTEDIAELTKLKYKTVQINANIKRAYEKLGGSVYKMVKADYEDSELVASMVAEIDALLADLREANEKIADIRNIALCPSCSEKNPHDAAYCCKCGTRLSPDEEVEEDS